MENLNFLVDIIKVSLETLYYLAGILLLVVAWKGLGQIREAKNQVKESKKARTLSSKREAYKIAADKCEYYMNSIIPLQDNLNKAIEDQGITFFKNWTAEIEGNVIKKNKGTIRNDEREKVMALPTLQVFNSMEAFAIFFTSGVADENVAYLTVGRTYCETVKRYLAFLADLSDDGYFKNVLTLFLTWENRFEKERLEKERVLLDAKLNKTTTTTIQPIGVE